MTSTTFSLYGHEGLLFSDPSSSQVGPPRQWLHLALFVPIKRLLLLSCPSSQFQKVAALQDCSRHTPTLGRFNLPPKVVNPAPRGCCPPRLFQAYSNIGKIQLAPQGSASQLKTDLSLKAGPGCPPRRPHPALSPRPSGDPLSLKSNTVPQGWPSQSGSTRPDHQDPSRPVPSCPHYGFGDANS